MGKEPLFLLFIVGELSGRIPICPSGYAITVAHDGYFVVRKSLTLFAIVIILSEFAVGKRLAEKYLTFLLLLS